MRNSFYVFTFVGKKLISIFLCINPGCSAALKCGARGALWSWGSRPGAKPIPSRPRGEPRSTPGRPITTQPPDSAARAGMLEMAYQAEQGGDTTDSEITSSGNSTEVTFLQTHYRLGNIYRFFNVSRLKNDTGWLCFKRTGGAGSWWLLKQVMAAGWVRGYSGGTRCTGHLLSTCEYK